MANPNPNLGNLKPFKKGQSGNPFGKQKGTHDMSTHVRRILNRKIDWDKITIKNVENLKRRYGEDAVAEALAWVQVSKALTGDTRAFNALREAGWGKTIQPEAESLPNVVHIYKPEKLSYEELEIRGTLLREHTKSAIEAELIH